MKSALTDVGAEEAVKRLYRLTGNKDLRFVQVSLQEEKMNLCLCLRCLSKMSHILPKLCIILHMKKLRIQNFNMLLFENGLFLKCSSTSLSTDRHESIRTDRGRRLDFGRRKRREDFHLLPKRDHGSPQTIQS